MREPATRDVTVESEGMEKSPAPCFTTESELRQESDLIDFYSELPKCSGVVNGISSVVGCIDDTHIPS